MQESDYFTIVQPKETKKTIKTFLKGIGGATIACIGCKYHLAIYVSAAASLLGISPDPNSEINIPGIAHFSEAVTYLGDKVRTVFGLEDHIHGHSQQIEEYPSFWAQTAQQTQQLMQEQETTHEKLERVAATYGIDGVIGFSGTYGAMQANKLTRFTDYVSKKGRNFGYTLKQHIPFRDAIDTRPIHDQLERIAGR